MDKTAIRNFAIEARKILMKSAITEAGFYGVTKDGCKDPVQKGNDFEVYETVAGTENRIFGDDIKRRANLVQAIKTLGFEQVIEETAYTWFNRIIAIRFMEVNNYLPTRVRVLSSETGSGTPDIITQVDTVELNLSSDELEKIQNAKRENRYDDAFRMLFIKQCNELNTILPGLFEKTDDYMELLLKITYTGDGVIRMLVDSIPEDNFNVDTEGQVEIIGWMYQYYNTELKDDTFAKLKKNVKVTKERIPAATQLFTPDWIVRYMVENSLGRVWIEHLRAVNPSVDEKAKAEEFGWKYYLTEAEQEEEVQAQLVEIRKSYKDLTPQDITCIDPCMGSGHILVYMFDVLMDIYRSEGFSEREAVFDILEKNIRGLDIDRRAYQLSYFALMMKAREYNRIFFCGHENIDGNRVQAMPRVYAIEESNSIDREQLAYFGAGLDELSKNNAINQINGLLDSLKDAKEYGSILDIDNYDWDLIRSFLANMKEEDQGSLFGYIAFKSKGILSRLVDVGEILAKKYDAVVTNPPYMNIANTSVKLNSYVKKKYPENKSDLYGVFIEKCAKMTKKLGYQSMITQHTWMFLSRSEKLRNTILDRDIVNLNHLGTRAFEEIGGEVVQTVAFVVRNSKCNSYLGKYVRLVDYNSQQEKELRFKDENNYFLCKQKTFDSIPGRMFIYWQTEAFMRNFDNKLIGDVIDSRVGLDTGDNDKFVRLWHEVDFEKIIFNAESEQEVCGGKKWVPHTKGGPYRKWYGNFDCVLAFDSQNYSMLLESGNHLPSRQFYFKEGITWSRISTSNFAVRYSPKGMVFNSACPTAFADKDTLLYSLGLLNSVIVNSYVTALSPTMNFQAGDINKVPYIASEKKEEIIRITSDCIECSREDWNSFENSWDFEQHPLVAVVSRHINDFSDKEDITIEKCFELWAQECDERFYRLKDNEEKINEILIDIYGLRGELEPNVDDKDITVRKADLGREIRSLLSYAVGCMFGRYSLVEKGVVFAGGRMDDCKYGTFAVDKDAIIPITDEQYLDDDIVGRLEDFLKNVYGNKSLEKNMEYVAKGLGTKGNSSREKIRNYFINDFYKDHCSIYSASGSGKRPIYWLFDSGKDNGFKCLIYIHRYTNETVGLIRSDYLTKVQSMIENALRNAEYAISTSSSAVDRAQATKKRDKYIKQLAEIRSYYPALSHIALQKIDLNLDDGVKANYAKFQGIEVSVEGEKKQKVDLLAKI